MRIGHPHLDSDSTEDNSSADAVSDDSMGDVLPFDRLPEQISIEPEVSSSEYDSTSDVSEKGEPFVWEPEEKSSAKDMDTARKELPAAFAAVQAETHCKHSVAKKFYLTAIRQRHRLLKVDGKWKSYASGRRRLEKRVPKIQMWYYFWEKQQKVMLHPVGPLTKLPQKKYLSTDKYTLKATWSRVALADALRCHDITHKRHYKCTLPSWKDHEQEPVEILMSMDGVPIDNTSDECMEVISIKFPECLRVWPIGIYIGKGKEKDLDRALRQIIEELKTLNVKVILFLADSPQRATLLNAEAVTSYMGCYQCKAIGQENSGEGASVVWPPTTMGQAARTMEGWKKDVEEASVTARSCNGIKGPTPLAEIVPDLINQVPIDVFHVLYLGMTKRVVKNLLGIRKTTQSVAMRKVKETIDARLCNLDEVMYPSEFLRRPRPINLPKYKSAEWRHLASAAFPIISDTLWESNMPSLNKLWAHFVFLLKAVQLHDVGFEELCKQCPIDKIMENFYKLYVAAFKERECAPNVHMFYHVVNARKKMNLRLMSTEPFESFYAILKKSYHPGTKSIGKQILVQVYSAYQTREGDHKCQPSLRVRPTTKARTNDSLILSTDGYFYKVTKKLGTGNYLCRRIFTKVYRHPSAPELPFKLVFVRKFDGTSMLQKQVKYEEIAGKAVLCRSVISLVPEACLYG